MLYASSPVEHAGTHTRTGSPAGRDATISGITSFSSDAKASESRKKLVTPMRSSRNRVSVSTLSARRTRAYSSRLSAWVTTMRRSTRRRIVDRLYMEKSCPVLSRSSTRMRVRRSSSDGAAGAAAGAKARSA